MRICWLEQSGIIDEGKARLKKDLEKVGVDYYRFNWKLGSQDPHSNVFADAALSWSKGRELLLQHASSVGYDYYIVVDDDVYFDVDIEQFFSIVRRTTIRYRPHVLFVRGSGWQETWLKFIPRIRAVSTAFISDLQIQIYSDYAVENYCLPVRHDGGWGTMWYIPILIDRDFVGKVLRLNDIMVYNLVDNISGNYGGDLNISSDEIWNSDRHLLRSWIRVLASVLGRKTVIRFVNFLYGFRKAG